MYWKTFGIFVAFATISGSLADAEDIAKIQQDLQTVGCYDGPVDGEISQQVEEAIRCFQKTLIRQQDGSLSDVELRGLRLKAENHVVQEALAEIGCYDGEINGRLVGSEELKAGRCYRRVVLGVKKTGNLTEAERTALLEDFESRQQAASDEPATTEEEKYVPVPMSPETSSKLALANTPAAR